MNHSLTLQLLAFCLSLTIGISWASAQHSPFEGGNDEAFFVKLDSYMVYGGEIKVIDGLTGNKYTSGNEVVRSFYNSMPKIMGGFHKMLLAYESANIQFRIEDNKAHAKALTELADSFGIKRFSIDQSKFLTREIAIYNRLRSKPFFHLDEIVVWEQDYLEPGELPDNKYAANIRYNTETETWHRRALTHWIVEISDIPKPYTIHKYQGLDLDTQSGFHELNTGLPGKMSPSYFRDVKLSYPIIIDHRIDPSEQIDYLQRTFFKNLRHLYDPFSWKMRRDYRFVLGFAEPLRYDLSQRVYKIGNRKWFDPVISTFLNDVIVERRHGYKAIYRDIANRRINRTYTNQLGIELDLLNWSDGEKRVPLGDPPTPDAHPIGPGLNFESTWGARYILLDAYMRKGDAFLEALRQELKAQKKKEDAIIVFKRVIEKTSGISAEKYIKLAFSEQRKLVSKYLTEAKENKQAALDSSQLETD